MQLLTTQKNSLFEIISSFNLSPNQFEFVDAQGRNNPATRSTKLKFKNSNFFFSFESAQNSTYHYAIYSPGESTYVMEDYPQYWKNQLMTFTKWVVYLKREITAPDKWENLHKQIDNLGVKFDNDERKFTIPEYEELSSKLEVLKSQLSRLDLLPEQIEALNSKIDFLAESAKSMSKFDWKSLFIGTIVNTTLQLALGEEQISLIWNLIKSTFQNYFLLG